MIRSEHRALWRIPWRSSINGLLIAIIENDPVPERIPMIRWVHIPQHPKNKTSGFDAVEILRRIQSVLVDRDWWDYWPVRYMSPRTRVISSMVAVPLVGSIAPKLQASLKKHSSLVRLHFNKNDPCDIPMIANDHISIYKSILLLELRVRVERSNLPGSTSPFMMPMTL